MRPPRRPIRRRPILNLKVCDPACGSGHFLIAAAHRIAKKLASVRTHEEEPAPDAVRHALRDVIGHCVFGVDINPMAVELCQVALWMEALEPGKPLSFLEHHIQCGNSLLGTTPALLRRAFRMRRLSRSRATTSNSAGRSRSRTRKSVRARAISSSICSPWERLGNVAAAIAALDTLPDDTADQVRAKERRYEKLVKEASLPDIGPFPRRPVVCGLRVEEDAAFDYPITERIFRRVETNPHDMTPWMYAEVRRLAGQYQFFHWHLAFPACSVPPAKGEKPDNELTGWCGGFDVVLGNPPWERIKLQEQDGSPPTVEPTSPRRRTAAARGTDDSAAGERATRPCTRHFSTIAVKRRVRAILSAIPAVRMRKPADAGGCIPCADAAT